jgi:3',5'-cyclic-AMP phosphodiesterase
MTDRACYLWLTDPHVKLWSKWHFLNTILDENPRAVLLTGDLAEGPFLKGVLDVLGRKAGRPIYFVLGNHELLGSDIASTHSLVREMCAKYRNLIWLTDNDIIPLNDEVALIGSDGWYDARIGNPAYIRYTFDWWMVKDFRKLPNMNARIEAFRALADKSAEVLSERLERALETYKSVYLLTHMPPWQEAHRATNPLIERFWAPYNCNIALGQALEKVMEKHKKRQLTVLAGHTHTPVSIHVARNIECRVGKASYAHITDGERIFI